MGFSRQNWAETAIGGRGNEENESHKKASEGLGVNSMGPPLDFAEEETEAPSGGNPVPLSPEDWGTAMQSSDWYSDPEAA